MVFKEGSPRFLPNKGLKEEPGPLTHHNWSGGPALNSPGLSACLLASVFLSVK